MSDEQADDVVNALAQISQAIDARGQGLAPLVNVFEDRSNEFVKGFRAIWQSTSWHLTSAPLGALMPSPERSQADVPLLAIAWNSESGETRFLIAPQQRSPEWVDQENAVGIWFKDWLGAPPERPNPHGDPEEFTGLSCAAAAVSPALTPSAPGGPASPANARSRPDDLFGARRAPRRRGDEDQSAGPKWRIVYRPPEAVRADVWVVQVLAVGRAHVEPGEDVYAAATRLLGRLDWRTR